MSTSEVELLEKIRVKTEKSLNQLIKDIGPIQIGNRRQFPFGWRKAAKGRTVWRILEEAINQNIEKFFEKYDFTLVEPAISEVSVFDVLFKIKGFEESIYMNIKSAVKGGRRNKDDISKAIGLIDFYTEDKNRKLFIASFVVDFLDNMSIVLEKCIVMPITWLPDVYVNPSNNGNLQSAYYKDIDKAVKRTNKDFITELKRENDAAIEKKKKKQKK